MSISPREPDTKACEQRFVLALRQLLRQDKPMSQVEMAALFEEDGYLGSEMRHLLMEQGQKA